ncbi:hypothetical protein DXG01_011162 [Tephrocybe rancida]|nr:hypothetical protein DXG01_011162 [Tephrocybe rancida]
MFLRTLKAAPELFGGLVKGITLHAFIPPNYGASFSRHVQSIIDLCPSIARFAVTSFDQLPTTVTLPTLGDTITYLQLQALSAAPEADYRILDFVCGTLVSLSIGGIRPDKSLLFPRLNSLVMDMSYGEPGDLDHMRQKFTMPLLRQFTFKSQWKHELKQEFARAMSAFLYVYGCNLRFLQVHTRYNWPEGTVQRFLNACPILEHLVLHPLPTQAFAHPTVRWLDVSRKSRRRLCPRLQGIPPPSTSFPKLQVVRSLASAFEYLWKVSSFLPPDPLLEDGLIELSFPGIFVQHRQDSIWIRGRGVDGGSLESQRNIDLYRHTEDNVAHIPDPKETVGPEAVKEVVEKHQEEEEEEEEEEWEATSISYPNDVTDEYDLSRSWETSSEASLQDLLRARDLFEQESSIS